MAALTAEAGLEIGGRFSTANKRRLLLPSRGEDQA